MLLAAIGLVARPAVLAQDQPAAAKPTLGCAEMERFLREARIGTQSELLDGVTLPKRTTLHDSNMRHDAAIQTIDEREEQFRDYWGFNVAGYRLARLLGINMVPPYVERKIGAKQASLSWWVNDAMMEQDRVNKRVQPPDVEYWNRQMFVARVFHQLIRNMDPNLKNFLITRDWRLWLIDFSRAFGAERELPNPKDLMKCDRKLLARLKELNQPLLERELKPYLNDVDIDGLLARRDVIVKFFEDEIARKGEAEVLFDLNRVGEPCGVGL